MTWLDDFLHRKCFLGLTLFGRNASPSTIFMFRYAVYQKQKLSEITRTGFNMPTTPLKNISQIGSFPQVGVKIKKYLKSPPSKDFLQQKTGKPVGIGPNIATFQHAMPRPTPITTRINLPTRINLQPGFSSRQSLETSICHCYLIMAIAGYFPHATLVGNKALLRDY